VVAEGGRLVVRRVPVPKPSDSEVLVRVHATAVNRDDTLQLRGDSPLPPGTTDVLGLEMAGTVVAGGFGDWKPGDRCMAMVGGGGYADYALVPEGLLMRVPKGLDLPSAAGIPETWLTAFSLLHQMGDLGAGDFVLVYAAGSGVGTAAIQLASAHGAHVIATAGSEEKLATARRLGATACFNYKEGPFAQGVLDATGGKGVQLVLDCVGGSYWNQTVEVLAEGGRWVLYGLMGGASVDGPVLEALLRKRIRLEATTLRSRSLAYRVDITQRFVKYTTDNDRFSWQDYGVVLDSSRFRLDEAALAHERMEGNKNIGKIILTVAPSEAKL